MFLYGQRRENVLHEIPCRTVFTQILFDRGTILVTNSGTAVVLANLSQSYSTSSVPSKSQYLVFMTLVVLNFYFNLGLASVHSKSIRKIITFWTLHRQYVTVEAVRKIPFISLLNVPYLQLSGIT